jgi:hypothetical protein
METATYILHGNAPFRLRIRQKRITGQYHHLSRCFPLALAALPAVTCGMTGIEAGELRTPRQRDR